MYIHTCTHYMYICDICIHIYTNTHIIYTLSEKNQNFLSMYYEFSKVDNLIQIHRGHLFFQSMFMVEHMHTSKVICMLYVFEKKKKHRLKPEHNEEPS